MSVENAFKNRWTQLSPNLKRNLVIGGIVLALLALLTVVNRILPRNTPITDKQATIRNILTDVDPRSVGIDSLANQLKQVIQTNNQLMQRMGALEKHQKKATQTNDARFSQFSKEQDLLYRRKMDEIHSTLGQARKDSTPSPASPLVLPPDEKTDPKYLPSSSKPALDLENLFNQQPTYRKSPLSALSDDHNSDGPDGGSVLKVRLIKAKSTQTYDEKKSTQKKTTSQVFLPAGTILSGALLNGLDAPTGRGASRQPFPVLVRIKDEAILPNYFNADVRECFLVAAGYGDLSAERAYIRGETFSCVRNDGGVIEVPMDAYAVGEDGKVGIRGRVVNKQGALLANALMAGFLRGFSDAFGRNQTQVLALAGPGGIATTPFERAFSREAVEGGALKGAGYAMDKLANYYIDLAEDIFPVIEIDTTRKVEFILQRGLSLKLYAENDSKFSHFFR